MSDYESAMRDWYRFVDDTKSDYGVDMNVLSNPFSEEQKKYYMQVNCQTWWCLKFFYCFVSL